MYKVGDKVRIVDVDKIHMGRGVFRNGDTTIIFWHSGWNRLALFVAGTSTGLILFEEEYEGIEKVENDN